MASASRSPAASSTGERLWAPSMAGRYFFADISARVWSLTLTVDPATREAVASGLIEHTAELGGPEALGLISSFGVDASGELYLVNHTQGRILRLSSSVPIAVDTDHDGLPDSWELQYGLNPNMPPETTARTATRMTTASPTCRSSSADRTRRAPGCGRTFSI